jgi:hypothetical protein
MKKSIALFLAFLLVFALVACAKSTTTPPAGTSAPPAATPDAPPAGGGDAPPAPPAGGGSGSVGYWDDDVDHNARPKLKICYAMPAQSIMHEMFITAMTNFQDRMNFEIVTSSADSNTDTYINNLYIMAGNGVDGFFVDSDPNINERIKEVLDEIGIPYLAFIQVLLDDDGLVMAPVVMLDGYDCGVKQADWFYDNYKDYWGDIDTTKIMMVDITITVAPDMHLREIGAVETFKKHFPNNDKFVELDMVNQMLTADAAYDMLNPVITTHPEVEYWYISALVDFYGQGAARLVDALGLENRAIVTSTGIDVAQSDWANGYKGPWASLGISNYDTCVPALAGLIALCDGRATIDTLWKERAIPGDHYGNKYGIWYVETKMVTYKTCEQYVNAIQTKYGVA